MLMINMPKAYNVLSEILAKVVILREVALHLNVILLHVC